MRALAIIVTGLIICASFFIAIKSFSSRKGKITNDAKGFAVVELFTSEGCSSCPPADAALAKVSNEFAGKVFALEFHVDYWDRLGWKDEFSNHAYTQRQGNYSSQFHLNSVYTPQAIVNGKTEFTGSNTAALYKNINKELATAVNMNIDIKATINGDNATVVYKLQTPLKGILNVALVQLKAQSNVTRGENEGNVLNHINVVRDFASADVSKVAFGNVKLKLPAGFKANDFSLVAYLQNTTGEISGAKEISFN